MHKERAREKKEPLHPFSSSQSLKLVCLHLFYLHFKYRPTTEITFFFKPKTTNQKETNTP